jgi:tRNA (mo5U34)-methyltransferase
VHELPQGSSTPADGSEGDLAQRIAHHWWYHSIELPDGTVTPGLYDHRPLIPQYGLPASLAGQRALDVATFDGFWAFELERRGAEVVATDIGFASDLDMPPQVKDALLAEGLDRASGDGFRLAHEALGSGVDRVERSVYELDPTNIGMFDFVHMADLLLHVADPLGALRGVRRVTKGQALIVDCFDPELGPGLTRYRGGWSGGVWWAPGLDTLAQMILDAGFGDVEVQTVYSLGTKKDPRGPWRSALLASA